MFKWQDKSSPSKFCYLLSENTNFSLRVNLEETIPHYDAQGVHQIQRQQIKYAKTPTEKYISSLSAVF